MQLDVPAYHKHAPVPRQERGLNAPCLMTILDQGWLNCPLQVGFEDESLRGNRGCDLIR